MIPDDRRTKILNALEQSHYLSVEELAAILYVSMPTIRRDLTALEKEGTIKRTHGGASIISQNPLALPFTFTRKFNVEDKMKVGKIAAEIVSDGDSIFVDFGSSTLYFTKFLLEKRKLKVMTNGLIIAQQLSENENIDIEISGGTYFPKHASIYGHETIRFIENRHADFCFSSCSGIHATHGFTVNTEQNVPVKQAFQKFSTKNVLLMDHTKFNMISYYKVFDFSQVDILISDRELPEDLKAACEKNNVKVLF